MCVVWARFFISFSSFLDRVRLSSLRAFPSSHGEATDPILLRTIENGFFFRLQWIDLELGTVLFCLFLRSNVGYRGTLGSNTHFWELPESWRVFDRRQFFSCRRNFTWDCEYDWADFFAHNYEYTWSFQYVRFHDGKQGKHWKLFGKLIFNATSKYSYLLHFRSCVLSTCFKNFEKESTLIKEKPTKVLFNLHLDEYFP